MGIKACALRLLNEDGETLTLRAAYGLSERYLRKGPVMRAQSPLDRAALQGQVVIVPNVATNPLFQYPQAAQEEGIASVLCVPSLSPMGYPPPRRPSLPPSGPSPGHGMSKTWIDCSFSARPLSG